MYMGFYRGFDGFYWVFFKTVRDDDSDYLDGQMADTSQVNSPSLERRSPIHQRLTNDNECMFL